MDLLSLLSRSDPPGVAGAVVAVALNAVMLWVVAYAGEIPVHQRRRLLLLLGVMHAALFAILGWRLAAPPGVVGALAAAGLLAAFTFARLVHYCHSCSRPTNLLDWWRRRRTPDLPGTCELCGAPQSARGA